MSIYQLAPPPPLTTRESSYASWENGFTDDQLSRICEICDSLILEPAVINQGEINDNIRVSETGWLPLNDDTLFIYDSLGYIARQLNGQFFEFDLFGFVEDLQYTVYRDNGGRYDWHLDRGDNTNSPRKLSLVLQLSDPDEYEGGDLEIFTGAEPTKVIRQKGLVSAFPSFVLHRVTPVTSGTRKTLVVWLSGPKFK